jgi:HD-GYP domain-containing protein (c-di-GMP phosphodiesterase class II)
MKDPEAYQALLRYTRALSVALGYRDLHTRIHSDRVLSLCDAIGLHLGVSDEELALLRISATFHDIGKIGIPDSVLLKPGRLDAAETAVMQRHAAAGESIVLATELAGAAEAARLIRHHHEAWNGRGYPDGLAGAAIPLCSRIIGVADSYDAMTTVRSYHAARSHLEAMRVLEEETGAKHDPELMRVFREVIERHPQRAA